MAKKSIPTVRLVDTRKTVDPSKPHLSPLPVEGTINNGEGVNRYLAKRHPESGKQIFYWPERWAALPPADKANALNHTPVADQKSKAVAADLERAYDAAGPDAQAALIERLLPALAERLGLTESPKQKRADR